MKIREMIAREADDRLVTLVAVSKYATVAQMREAYQAGVRNFGENKVQDALVKIAAFPESEFPDLRWHFIGSLQGNKVKKTVGRFHLIQSVDSVALAENLSRQNQAVGQKQAVLLQVNVSADPSRHGFLPESLLPAAEQLLSLPGIALRGLMAMAPPEASIAQDELALKSAFGNVSALRDAMQDKLGIDLPDLSMGMTHDFPQALACGATIIRIGNYLFKS